MMQDRFKFRVWNKEKNEMEYDLYDSPGDIEVSCINEVFKNYLSDDRNIVEQCTGLKDKKDKLIYEGDILNSLYKDDGCRGLYVVVWSNGSLCVKKVGNHQQTFVNISLNDLTRCEVIGNIHENPDLLEEKFR